MLAGGSKGKLRRGLADFTVALALFWAIALTAGGDHNTAHAVPLPAIGHDILLDAAVLNRASLVGAASSQTNSDFHRPNASRRQEQVLLSLAFAAIVAFNLAFLRHLRRVYASPRRSVWRRG